MRSKKKQPDEELNFWQPAADMFSGLMLVLLLVILLLGLYLVNIPEELYPEHDGIATPANADGEGEKNGIGGDIKRPDTNTGGNPDETGDGGHERGDDGGDQEYDGSGGEERYDGGSGGGNGGSGSGNGVGPGEGMKSAVFVVMVDAQTDRTIKEADVQFELYGADNSLQVLNTYYPEKISYRQYETTDQGTFYFPEKLWQGQYIVHELTEPTGYDMAENQEFDLNDIYDWPEPFVVKVPLNPSRNVIRIQMNDKETGLPVTGGTFEVIAAEDIVTEDGTLRYHEAQVVGEIVCNEEGYGVSDELYLGNYIVRQKEIPQYYIGQESELDCIVEKKTEVEAPLNTLDSVLTRAIVTLTDELYNTRPIEGVSYTVTSDKGSSKEVVTDASGKIVLEQLDKNTVYTLRQTGTKDDYLLDTQEYTFNVAPDGRIGGEDELDIGVTNRMIRVEVDASNLPFTRQSAGIDLELYDASNTRLKEWTTSSTPLTLTDLKPGNYYIVMNGNMDKKYSFQVNDQAAVQRIYVGTGHYIMYIVLAGGAAVLLGILVAGAIGIHNRNKGKNKKK